MVGESERASEWEWDKVKQTSLLPHRYTYSHTHARSHAHRPAFAENTLQIEFTGPANVYTVQIFLVNSARLAFSPSTHTRVPSVYAQYISISANTPVWWSVDGLSVRSIVRSRYFPFLFSSEMLWAQKLVVLSYHFKAIVLLLENRYLRMSIQL